MKNISYILLLGLAGTILSMIFLTLIILLVNNMVWDDGDVNKLYQSECLLLAAVLCATDTVAALTIVRENQFPTLNSILFGEGVVNDAVAILIYKAVQEMILRVSEEGEVVEEVAITLNTIGITLWNFIYVSVLSVVLGLGTGLISAVISKRMTSIKGHTVKEVFLIILIGYLSYIIGEVLELSPIMSLFVCGVT